MEKSITERKLSLSKIFLGVCALAGVSIPFEGCFKTVYGPAEVVYGPPDSTPYEVAQLYGLVTAKTDGTKLAGIKVTVLLGDTEIVSTVTDSNGNYYVSLSSGLLKTETVYTIRFDDADGAANGLYASFSDTVTLDSLSVSTKKNALLDLKD